MNALTFLAGLAIALPSLAADLQPTEGYLPRFTRTVERPSRATIDLQTSFPEGHAGMPVPVTFGVPFPRGALASDENVRLLQDGQPIPAMIRRTATWEGPDGDVKWLLVDATMTRGGQYALEYGTRVAAEPAGPGVTVQDSPAGIVVSTGPMRFSVRRDASRLIDGAWLDTNGDGAFAPEEALIEPGSSPPPYMVDAGGTRHEVSAKDEYTVTVEQSGPLHAIIKTHGWFSSAGGDRLCEHIARLHAYAGQSFIRIEHTFVVAFDTETNQIRDIALPFVLPPGEGKRYTFAVDDGKRWGTDEPAALVQDQAGHFSILREGEKLVEGAKAGGWVDASRGAAGMLLGIRHLWQEFPRELEATENALIAHLWPAHSDKPLDFDARAVLGPERYAQFDGVFWQSWYEGGLTNYDQAIGLAKSNDLILAFHGPDASGARAVTGTLDRPVIVSATPEWMCRSDVMGPLHPVDRQRFPDEEQTMDAAFTRFELLREHMGNYGMIDYGDVNYVVNEDAESKQWLRRPWRCWASRFYGHPVMPWVQFLRTGRRKYLQWGIDNSRHVMDIDIAHVTDESLRYPKRRGGRFGGNGGIIHYAGNIYDIGCDSHVDQFLLQYYLTGYRRAWDVLQEEAEFYLWLDKRPGGALHSWAHRMTGGALRTMICLYNATWDERYLTIAQRMAGLCYDNQDPEGVIRHDDVYMLPGMFTYYQATGDARMRELILRCMRRQAKVGRNESDPRSFGFYGLSMAYFLTRDASYLPWAERWRQEFLDRIDQGDDPFWFGAPRGEWDYCYNTLHLLYMPYYLQALADLGESVEPAARDNAVTSGDVLLYRESDEPFSVVLEWFCYEPSLGIGVTLNSYDRYVARNPVDARVVLRGPDGGRISTAPVDIAPGKRSGKVVLDVPAGDAGVYGLSLSHTPLPLQLRIASSDLTKWAYSMDHSYICCADAYHFHVPEGTREFSVAFKGLALRRPVTYTVRDSAGEVVRSEEITYKASPQRDFITWAFEPKQEQTGGLWSFSTDPSNAQLPQVFLHFEGVPDAVWTSPSRAFSLPEDLPLSAQRPPAPRPYTEAGASLGVEPGAPFTIPRGEKRAEGCYANLDARQGTLEFWLLPNWLPADLTDRTIARCGKLHLYRRSDIGTYLGLAGTHQSGFATQPGHWVHIAAVWDAGEEGRKPETRLFINGVRTGTMMWPPKEPLGDWTGETLAIGGTRAFKIDDVVVSDVMRYEEDFDPPTQPTEDEHTLFVERF